MATAAARSSKEFTPCLVHAYRRLPHTRVDKTTGLEKEVPVEVVFNGEKVYFISNERGHIVGLVKTWETFNRLTKEIPEAYIPYAGGENIPERKSADDLDRANQVVVGTYVLKDSESGDVLVLDVKDDAWLRAFLESNDVTDIHESLSGDTLRQAVVNRFKTD